MKMKQQGPILELKWSYSMLCESDISAELPAIVISGGGRARHIGSGFSRSGRRFWVRPGPSRGAFCA